MYTKPSIVDTIRAVMTSLSQDIAPELSSSRSQVCLLMAQSLLQSAIQRVEAEHAILIAEHNEMVALYQGLATELGECSGAAAERIRARGQSFGQRPPLPAPVPAGELATAHHSLSQELIHTLSDLDELIRDGDSRATAALAQVRQHLLVRTARDFQTHLVNPGSLAGRD